MHTYLLRKFVITLLLCSAVVPPAFCQQPLPAEGDEPQLITVLQSEGDLFEKAKACQRLAVIGTSDSIPALVELLSDDQLSHYARTALETNPSSDVDQALRSALKDLSGQQLVGVINSIGIRRDTQAVEQLIELAKNDDQQVAKAAIAALGAIASNKAIEAVTPLLNQSGWQRMTAADACLTAADELLKQEQKTNALKLFEQLKSSDLPEHIQVAARFGVLRADPKQGKKQMVEYLQSKEQAFFRIGLELAHEFDDSETTKMLVGMLDSLPPARRVLVLHVLGERGDTSAIDTVIEAAKSDDVQMQLAAVNVLGKLGGKDVVPILIEAAVSENESLAASARNSLVVLDEEGVDEELATRLENDEGAIRLVLVDLAGKRAISRTIPLLLQLASSEDPQLRDLAIDGLGMTVGLKDFPRLIDQLLQMQGSSPATPMKEALRKACQRMGDRAAAANVLLDRMDDATPAGKIELMELLVFVGGDQALSGAKAAASSDDKSAADAATQALGKWLTPDAAPVLLELAQSGNTAYQIRCLRGYIRIIRQFGLKPGERLRMSKAAFAAATRDEERKLILDTLTRFPSTQGLKMIKAHLDNPSLSGDASRSAVAIGEKIVDNDPSTVAAVMPKVIAVAKDREIAKRAQVLLSRAK